MPSSSASSVLQQWRRWGTDVIVITFFSRLVNRFYPEFFVLLLLLLLLLLREWWVRYSWLRVAFDVTKLIDFKSFWEEFKRRRWRRWRPAFLWWCWPSWQTPNFKWNKRVSRFSIQFQQFRFNLSDISISAAFLRHFNVIFTSFSCHFQVIRQRCVLVTDSIPNRVIFMSFSCHFHVIFMSFSCHFHVIFPKWNWSFYNFQYLAAIWFTFFNRFSILFLIWYIYIIL